MALTSYPLVTVTPGAANTKGAYTTLVASTPYDSSRLYLELDFSTSQAVRFLLVDVATGAAGAETVIVANIATAIDADNLTGEIVPLSVDVPAGTRLALRAQSVSGTLTGLAVGLLLEDRALASLANPVTYGADTANSRGTQIDPGTTVNTKGAYTQFTASTATRIDALVICTTTAAQGTAVPSGGMRWRIDVATGGAGAETVILPNLQVIANATEDKARPAIVVFPVAIPAGTRLAVRCDSSINTATIRLACVTLIGLQEPAASSGGSAAAVAYVG